MRTFTLAVIITIALMLCFGCDKAVAPDLEAPDNELANITVDEVVAFIESSADVDYSVRHADTDLPIWQLREWLAWWFADNYSDLLSNSKYDKAFMACYFYKYAIFIDGDNYYFGSYGMFVESGVFNDFQIYAFATALEQAGHEVFYPIEPPC